MGFYGFCRILGSFVDERMELIFNPDSQPQNHPKECGQVWESDDQCANLWIDDSSIPDAGSVQKSFSAWMVATPLTLSNQSTHVELDLGCTRSIGSRTAIERFKEREWNSSVATSLSCQHRNRNLQGKLHHSFSSNPTMFYQG